MDKNEVKITIVGENESPNFVGVCDKKTVKVDDIVAGVNFVEKKEDAVVHGGGESTVSNTNKVDKVRTVYAGDDVWVRSDGARVKYCDACLFEVLEEEWSLYRNVCIDCEHRWSIETDPGWPRRKRKYDAGLGESTTNSTDEGDDLASASESEATSRLF